MGKQIRFYMAREDEMEFLDYVRTTGDILILPEVAETSPLEEVESYRYFFDLESRRLGDSCFVWNRSISPTPEFVWYPEYAYYNLSSSMESEVISVMRCKLVDRALCMGRLYMDHERLDEAGRVAKKSKAFIDWYDRLCRWLRRKYKHRIDTAYTSPRVKELLDRGLAVTGHCF